MSGHTPGPWRCEVGTNDVYLSGAGTTIRPHYVLNRTGNAAAVVTRDEAFANARLIAAAPELLEALKAILESAGPAGLVIGSGLSLIATRVIEDARAVLAKAEGRS